MLKERKHSPRGMFDFFRAACSEVFGRFSAESFGKAFFKSLRSMRQSLISMRELQLSLQCFKKTKFTSAFWIESMLPEFREASRSVILRAKRAEDHSSSDFLETEQNPLCPQLCNQSIILF